MWFLGWTSCGAKNVEWRCLESVHHWSMFEMSRWIDLSLRTKILKSILCSTGSQCSSVRSYDIGLYFLFLVINILKSLEETFIYASHQTIAIIKSWGDQCVHSMFHRGSFPIFFIFFSHPPCLTIPHFISFFILFSPILSLPCPSLF